MKKVLGMFCIVLAVAAFGCSKKSDPNASADSGMSGDGSGSVGESDIAGGGRSGSGAAMGLKTVYFDYDSATLSNDSRQTLTNNAQIMKSKTSGFTIEGHCDDRGSTEYNLALGERRANSVRDYLSNLGVTRNKLKTISFGEERPAVNGGGEAAWAKNRRAEFTVGN